MLRVFLDASVYFAGFSSKTGASFLILEIARKNRIKLYASRLVLREADRNLRMKSTSANLKAFRHFIQRMKIHVVPFPSEKTTELYESIVHPKDLPVLGAALEAGTDHLLTLDKKHLIIPQLVSKLTKPKIMSPGNFIKNIYLKGKV